MKSWGNYFLGYVSYQQNRLDAAAQFFTRIIENRYNAQVAALRDAIAGMAMIHQIRGEILRSWRCWN
jgi:hypothetical protein